MAYKECYLSTKEPCINSDGGIVLEWYTPLRSTVDLKR